MPAGLRIELFVADTAAFTDFWSRVLRFTVTAQQPDYAAVRRDGVRIGAARTTASVPRAARAVPAGTEIVLEVDDVRAEEAHVRAAGWPIDSTLREQPWGLTDFRVHDPDGYYVRITSR